MRTASAALPVEALDEGGRHGGRRLLLFGVNRLDDMLKKGNVWYVRHYEAYFDDVDVVYLHGRGPDKVTQGRTTLMSRGGRIDNFWLDLALAPLRLWLFARPTRPHVYVTADQVFSWWTTILIRVFLRARILLVPVAMPEQLYADNGRSLSGLPIWLERHFLRLSFRAAFRIQSEPYGEYLVWLSKDPIASKKMFVAQCMVDGLPAPEFYEAKKAATRPALRNERVRCVYVGRLHKEKLVNHIIRAFAELRQRGFSPMPELLIIGDGPERERLQDLARQHHVSDVIEFCGATPNRDLPSRLMTCDVFISPLTGVSLREAAVCGLAVVAYDRDWLKGVLHHDVHALLVAPNDESGFASAIAAVCQNQALRMRLSAALADLARELWSPQAVQGSLRLLYDECRSRPANGKGASIGQD